MKLLEALKLPKPAPVEKGKQKDRKKEISFAPHHMITKIDLSSLFASITPMGMRQMLEGAAELPCLRSLNLSNNRMDDEYEKEICSIFDNKKIAAIDLSKNLLKKTAASIGRKLKDECTHVTWIDLTQNDFESDSNSITTILIGLKKQSKLFYVGLSTRGLQTDTLVRIVAPKKLPFNLNMRNSVQTKTSMTYLCRTMSIPETYLSTISFKFNYLSFEEIHLLS
jgi:hypothetical protein